MVMDFNLSVVQFHWVLSRKAIGYPGWGESAEETWSWWLHRWVTTWRGCSDAIWHVSVVHLRKVWTPAVWLHGREGSNRHQETAKCEEGLHLCSIPAAQRPEWVGWYMTGFTALISGVRRLQAVTLEEFTLNLIFMVSWNGNCFLPVNKAVGTLPYNGCE